MSDKFTPGPWRWRSDEDRFREDNTLVGSDGSRILCGDDYGAVFADSPADAYLIAAAPVLYEALRQLERAFAVPAKGYRTVADREGALRDARAALRAARGEEA